MFDSRNTSRGGKMICECLNCCKEFEIFEELTKEEKERIICPYCGCGDIFIDEENE